MKNHLRQNMHVCFSKRGVEIQRAPGTICFCQLTFFTFATMWETVFKINFRTSQVAQWIRIHLPMLGAQVQSWVWKDPICHEAKKPVCHNHWDSALEPLSCNYWACTRLLKPTCLDPVLCYKRSHHNEKPTHHKGKQPPLAAMKTRIAKNKQINTK